MPSWAIIGATRGIGFEYVNQLSLDSRNTVFALIRSQATAGPLNTLSLNRKNIHIIETDISSVTALEKAATTIGIISGGKLDVLIYNAYSSGTDAKTLPPTGFLHKQDELKREILESINVNLIQVIYTVNAFLQLIQNSEQKKIIYISSGMGDVATTRTCEIPGLLGYSVSKAAGNILMAKYAVELKHQGILTLSLSPGWVETDAAKTLSSSPETFQWMLSSFQKMDPKVKGMISTEESVTAQLSVVDMLDTKLSGAFISHRGNDQNWF